MKSIHHVSAPGFSLDVSGEWWEEALLNRIVSAAFATFDERGFSFRQNVLPGLLMRPSPQITNGQNGMK